MSKYLVDQAPNNATRSLDQIQLDALQALLGQTEGHLVAERQAMAWYDAMVEAMQADLRIDPTDEFRGPSGARRGGFSSGVDLPREV